MQGSKKQDFDRGYHYRQTYNNDNIERLLAVGTDGRTFGKIDKKITDQFYTFTYINLQEQDAQASNFTIGIMPVTEAQFDEYVVPFRNAKFWFIAALFTAVAAYIINLERTRMNSGKEGGSTESLLKSVHHRAE